ncbi:hypothetical protein HanRHA438_Chr10g0442811 [Helianthus annuus]|nr:hypothetical protein HanRHA438_Chr10g0442811 [Helianthus annuus]
MAIMMVGGWLVVVWKEVARERDREVRERGVPDMVVVVVVEEEEGGGGTCTGREKE